jgi:class 3 adenylate cyclase
VQHLAESGEIVLEEDVFDALPEADRAQLRIVEKISAKVKGVEQPLRLVRTRLVSIDDICATDATSGQRNVA